MKKIFKFLQALWAAKLTEWRLESIKRYIFTLAREQGQYQGTLIVSTFDRQGRPLHKWEIKHELNPLYPASLVRDWERLKEEAQEDGGEDKEAEGNG